MFASKLEFERNQQILSHKLLFAFQIFNLEFYSILLYADGMVKQWK